MRKMALDVGDKRIGIAFSDPSSIIASGYISYTRKNNDEDFKYLASLVKEKEVDTLVIGLPINMDGTMGKRTEIVNKFGDRLKNFTEVKIAYQDERLSTVSAEKLLIEADVRRDKRKEVIDKVAASIILQSYLDTKK